MMLAYDVYPWTRRSHAMNRDDRLTPLREVCKNISGTFAEDPGFAGYFDLTAPVGPPQWDPGGRTAATT